MPVPYFSPNGQMFSLPFEWAGFYPLYITAAEANERSPSNSSHTHTFTWNAGTNNGGYPIWNNKTINTTMTFYMPNGLTAADANTPERQYLTHYWHGTHPGLPVWSVVAAAGAETGSAGFYSVNNGKAFEWTGPQNGTGVNLCTNTATYGGNRDNMIFPPAYKSDSLTAIKNGISVTVS